jgi:hypothetical protein
LVISLKLADERRGDNWQTATPEVTRTFQSLGTRDLGGFQLLGIRLRYKKGFLFDPVL